MKPKISFVMPFYNNLRDFQKAIESILTIDYCLNEIELILIDDCSEDGCSDIAEIYSEKYTFIKLYKNNSNLGPSKALKRALTLAEGEIIIFSAADDITLENRVKEILNIFDKNKEVGIVISEAEIINEFDHKTGELYTIPKGVTVENAALYQLKRNICLGAAMAIRNNQQIFMKTNFLDIIDDYQIALEYILDGWRIYPLKQSLVYYRVHASSVSAKKKELHLKTLETLKYYSGSLFENKLIEFGYPKNEVYNALAIFEFFKGNYLEAKRYFQEIQDDFESLDIISKIEYLFYVAIINYDEGRFDKAQEYWSMVLRHDPFNISTLNNLGVLMINQGDFEGIHFLQKALEKTSNYIDCQNNLNKISENRNSELIITRRLLNNNLLKRLNYLEEK